MDLQGRAAVITGGGRGIGSHIARSLAEHGATVVVSARSVDEIESVAKSLQSAGHEAHAIPCDVANETSVETMAQEVSRRIGDIDILVNNAGIARSNPVKVLQLQEWERILAINATGTFLCTRAFLGSMIERGWGRVINVASIAGLQGGRYMAAYSASKHAQVGFTRALAAEVADQGVTANAICPGYVDTAMADHAVTRIVGKTDLAYEEALQSILETNPQKRLIRPEEVAHIALMLCSDDAEGINGQAIVIDGGLGAH